MHSNRKSKGWAESAMLVLALPALLVLGACSDKSTSPNPALVITPTDGATNVRVDAPVVLAFGVSVDRSTVEGSLHLIAETAMDDTCPISAMGWHGTMEAVMADHAMMEHMAEFHSSHGHCAWNAAGTVCTFMPDSLMRARTRYMVYMSGDMVRMMQQRGGSMMGGTRNHSGDMMTHFVTMPEP